MQLAITNMIVGPNVHNMLRGTLLKACNIKGFHHFIVSKNGMGFDTTVVIPCSPEGTPAYTGRCRATSTHAVLCPMLGVEPSLQCVPPGAGDSHGPDQVRFCADMAALTVIIGLDTLPSQEIIKNFIFVCDRAGDNHSTCR